MSFLQGISWFCFAASYGAALVLEIARLVWPRPAVRISAMVMGGAGLFAHTVYMLIQQPSLASQGGSLLFLAWILAVFYFYGSLHHAQLAWGIFVLPVVLGLVILTNAYPLEKDPARPTWLSFLDTIKGEVFWASVHGALLLFAAVGGCIGFVASIMYLVQARRLRLKTSPADGVRMLSLERLETMNRRAINLAFPLLTAGIVVGAVLWLQRPVGFHGWTDPRTLGGMGLWLVLALLMYLRYRIHVRGRQLALLTIAAFVLLLFTLISSHGPTPGSTT